MTVSTIPRRTGIRVETLNVKNDFGAVGDGVADDTAAIQAAIDYVNGNHAVGLKQVIRVPSGKYKITQIKTYSHIRIIGDGTGTAHSTAAWWGTMLYQPAGTNLDMILCDDSATDSAFAHDLSIEKLSLRGGWTGVGDATTTAGSAIKFSGVSLGQNVRIRDLSIHNFPEHGIELTRHALPGMFDNIEGRMIGGDVLHIETVAGRISHMFYANNIQGDWVAGAIIRVDESALVSASQSSIANSYFFSNIKHEIDSNGANLVNYGGTDYSTTYGPDTIVLHNMDRTTVTVVNANAIPSDPNSTGYNPKTNAIVKITGTKAPMLTVIGSRMGSSLSLGYTDYLIDDQVNSITISKNYRSAQNLVPTRGYLASNSSADVLEETRQRVESTGVVDSQPRFRRDHAGKMEWGSGSATPDASLERQAANRLRAATTDMQMRRALLREGTALVAGDFALHANFGSGASVSVAANSTDSRFEITLTAGTGCGANPTITLTYKDGAFPVAPFGVVQAWNNASLARVDTALTRGSTTLVITFVGTPTDGNLYKFAANLLG
jgi:hypothetical protein